jgi:Tol biopolymer transport system component
MTIQRTCFPGATCAAFLPAVIALLLGAGCSSTMPILSSPAGASVTINSRPVGVTPLETPWSNDQENVVRFELSGYFPEEINLPKDAGQKAVAVELAAASRTHAYDIATQPPGAVIEIDGVQVGTTPARVEARFARTAKYDPWQEKRLTISYPDYQTETYRLQESTPAIGLINLQPLRVARSYEVSAVTRDGAELKADVTLDGQLVGATPLDLPVTFQRHDKMQAWPQFTVTVGVPGQYKAESMVIDFSSGSIFRMALSPISEITTTLIEPAATMTPTGVAWVMQETKTAAMLNTLETSDAVLDLVPVTNIPRQDLKSSVPTRAESINSFTVSPDGKNVIYALTARDTDGNLYSNLFIKRADKAGGIAQLTQGTRFIDTQPKIANDGNNYLLFTSNRSDHAKPDIFRANLIDNRISGGISRLTNDERFNFSPAYGDSNRQVFYLSTEANFPLAVTELSSIRINGTMATLLPITALEIDNSVPDKVYFVKVDDDSKKKQIYSIQADGNLESALISQEGFRNSNCFDPAPSPDGGSRIAFVSDAGADDHQRRNHDIYLVNQDGTGLQRLTLNGSDDIKPVWSPSEDGVLYFLSNRGGAYNIWRMKLRSGSNPSAPAGASH